MRKKKQRQERSLEEKKAKTWFTLTRVVTLKKGQQEKFVENGYH